MRVPTPNSGIDSRPSSTREPGRALRRRHQGLVLDTGDWRRSRRTHPAHLVPRKTRGGFSRADPGRSSLAYPKQQDPALGLRGTVGGRGTRLGRTRHGQAGVYFRKDRLCQMKWFQKKSRLRIGCVSCGFLPRYSALCNFGKSIESSNYTIFSR